MQSTPIGQILPNVNSGFGQKNRFLGISNRAAYIPILIPGLDPAHSGPKARIAIASFLRTLEHNSGGTWFTQAVRSSLLGFYNNETDQVAHRHLDRLLTALGITH